jgi:hypothetical protein
LAAFARLRLLRSRARRSSVLKRFQTPEKVDGKYDFEAEEVKRFGFDDEPT